MEYVQKGRAEGHADLVPIPEQLIEAMDLGILLIASMPWTCADKRGCHDS
jgi:hypothetical protein